MYEFAKNRKELMKLSRLAKYIQENPEKSLEQVMRKFNSYEQECVEHFYYVFGKNVPETLHWRNKNRQMLIYFMFTQNLDKEPDERVVTKNWRTYRIKTNDDVWMKEDKDLYAFEIYMIRQQRVPPAFYFNTRFSYKFLSYACLDVIQEKLINIKPLQKLIGERLYLNTLAYLQRNEICLKADAHFITTFSDEAVKNFDSLMEEAVYHSKIKKLLSLVKFDGWRKAKIGTERDVYVTLFQYMFLELYYHNRGECVKMDIFKDSFYDGCLQERINIREERDCLWYDEEFNSVDEDALLTLTPAQMYIYCRKELPPKKFCYDGWERETVNYYGNLYTVSQFWLICTKQRVPKVLQIDGWDDKNVIFSFSEYPHGLMQQRGNMHNAYNSYKILFGDDDIDGPFIVSQDGDCVICMESHKKLYNFCKNKHTTGFCKECYESMEKQRCPMCNCDVEII